MEYLAGIGIGFESLLSVEAALALTGGVLFGVLAGAMPGLSPSTAVALLVPFSYSMKPELALILLTAIYIASNYGGSITAVLINTPGTPAAALTAVDGYPLTRKGKAGQALGTALAASTLGGAFGVFILILFAVPLGQVALKFGPAEYFGLALFGLATVASMGTGSFIKAVIAVLFGLLIRTVGMDPISGMTRFTLGIDELYDGFTLIPALIGLFALSVVFEKVETGLSQGQSIQKVAATLPGIRQLLTLKGVMLRSSVLGTIIGIFPGAGATIATFISYDMAKRHSKKPEAFGLGSVEGVAAAEAANSSSVGGALVPLLALGIPGSATDAVLLGAFMLHNLVPGPLLFQDHPQVVYGILASLVIANLLILLLGVVGNRFFLKVISIPEPILYPMILVVAIVGSFSVNSSLFDVWACIGFGVVGWIFKRFGYPLAPIVLGIVLGDMIEQNFRRAVLAEGYGIFFSRPLSAILITLALLSFLLPLWKRFRPKVE